MANVGNNLVRRFVFVENLEKKKAGLEKSSFYER